MTAGSTWSGDDVISGRIADDDAVVDVVGCDMTASDHVISF